MEKHFFGRMIQEAHVRKTNLEFVKNYRWLDTRIDEQ